MGADVGTVLTLPGPPEPAPGLRLVRRCRGTGTTVSLYDSNHPEFPIDREPGDRLRWLLYCDHGCHEWFGTLRGARSVLSHPETWCARCVEIDEHWTDMEDRDDGFGPGCEDVGWVLRDGQTLHVRCGAEGCLGVEA